MCSRPSWATSSPEPRPCSNSATCRSVVQSVMPARASSYGVQELALEGASTRFVLPTTVAPRYQSSAGSAQAVAAGASASQAGVRGASAESQAPRTAGSATEYKLRVEALITTPLLLGVKSPSHQITAAKRAGSSAGAADGKDKNADKGDSKAGKAAQSQRAATTVSLLQGEASLDRDFVLSMEQKNPNETRAVIEFDEEQQSYVWALLARCW